jgi:Protein of unknown function (DUF3224)
MASRSLLTSAALLLAVALQQPAAPSSKGSAVSATAKGTFDAKVTPQPAVEGDDPVFTRFTVAKQFRGDLEGTSKVEMLAAATAKKDSGGYVALERVTATLGGRKGTFCLQHMGSMKAGSFDLTIVVVPDSGTDQLTGISGKFSIEIKDGKHFYSFDYNLPAD